MVCGRRASPVCGAAGAANHRFGKTSGLDLLVGRLGRADLAAVEWCEAEGNGPGTSGSKTALRVRREPLVLSRRRAVVLRHWPAHGSGREKGTAESADSGVRNG